MSPVIASVPSRICNTAARCYSQLHMSVVAVPGGSPRWQSEIQAGLAVSSQHVFHVTLVFGQTEKAEQHVEFKD